jgi:hypothetical protein
MVAHVRRTILLALALVGGGAVATPSALGAQTCPSDNVVARERMEFFLSDPQLAEERQSISVPTSAPVRALTNDAPDAWICDYLLGWMGVPMYRSAPWIYTFYESGGFYYIVLVKGPISETRVRIENGALQGQLYLAPFHVFSPQLGPVLDVMF